MHAPILIATTQQQGDANENDVLQFLLGAAPLSNKTTPRSSATKATTAQAAIGRSAAADLLSKLPALDTGCDANSDLLDVPVLEYGSDCESEDDYIDVDPAAFQERLSQEKLSADSSAKVESEENQDVSTDGCDPVAQDLDALPAVEDEPKAQSDTDVGEDLTLESIVLAGDDGGDAVKPAGYVSDTASNCTDNDGRSSDGEGADGLLEVEEESVEQLASVVGDKSMGDEKALLARVPAPAPPESLLSDTFSASSEGTISAQRGRAAEKAEEPHDHVDTFDAKNDEKRECKQVTELDEGKPNTVTKETQRDTVCVSTTEDEDTEASQQSSSDDDSLQENPKKTPSSSLEAPTPSEIGLVGIVAIGILFYVVATIYAYFHPIFLPLPSVESFQTPMNLTNASAVVTSPANHSIAQQPLFFEWTLMNYPVEAIDVYGPEAFQYRIYVNNKLIISEIGLLNTSSSVIGGGDHMKSVSSSTKVFNTTVKHRIPAQLLPDYGRYELLLQVLLPIPGREDDAVHSIEERVFITKAFEVGRKLELLAPADGTIFNSGESVVIEYRAANIARLDIEIDGHWVIHKQQIEDGSLLLRGLSAGQHTIALVGFDAKGKEISNIEKSKGLMATIEIHS